MPHLKNGKFSCPGKGCHTVYEAREVIDPANDDYGLYVIESRGTRARNTWATAERQSKQGQL